MAPVALCIAVVLAVGVRISCRSVATEKLTRPDCTLHAAVDDSADPPM
jgi:hypothetical protein